MKNNCLRIIIFLLLYLPMDTRAQLNIQSVDADYLHRAIKQVTDVIVHDIYSPPVASRIYAYVSIAGYEAAREANAGYVSFAGQLHGLKPLPKPVAGNAYNYQLAAVEAILDVAATMIISEEKITTFHTSLLAEIKSTGISTNEYDNSVEFGKQIATHIMAWAAEDNYKQSRSLSKYVVGKDAASWKPTPPGYMKAIEPNWNRMRTFLIDSAEQFKPLPPTPFSIDKSSQFYKEAKDVQEIGLSLTPEQTAIASFWDCNPFKMNINGHVMFATKKISPGGHWVNIVRLACKKANADFVRSAEAYACLSITLADGFISCWDEKYRSKVIRPETYINQYISNSWLPLLQTPPFPEYTSGHSVVSAASSIILTKLFGDNFSFTDSTEVEFRLPPRDFTSFKQAAKEAAISRFYGGIHYMPSITNGLDEGYKLGNFIADKLRTKKEDMAIVK
ncbi:MAG: vanadium-dependent haloperoxidase [Ferruginibacter sp.]